MRSQTSKFEISAGSLSDKWRAWRRLSKFLADDQYASPRPDYPLAAESAVAEARHALRELEKGTPAPSCTFIFTVRMGSVFNTERCSRLGAFPHFRDTSEQRVLRSGWYMHREQSASEKYNFGDKPCAGLEVAAVVSGRVVRGFESGAE